MLRDALVGIVCAVLAAYFAWNLGVRRERGRHAVLYRIQELEKEERGRAVTPRGHVRLHTIKFRRGPV